MGQQWLIRDIQYSEFTVDVMELIFVLAIVFHKVFLLYFFKIVEIIRTFGIYTFMNAEKFTVFLSNKVLPQ